MNAEFVVPAAAVEAAMQIAYPGMQHTGNPSYAYARKYVTKLLAAAAPALTHAAVEAEHSRVRAVLDRAKVVVDDWSDIGEEPTITVGDHSYVDHEFFDELPAAIDDPRIARGVGQ